MPKVECSTSMDFSTQTSEKPIPSDSVGNENHVKNIKGNVNNTSEDIELVLDAGTVLKGNDQNTDSKLDTNNDEDSTYNASTLSDKTPEQFANHLPSNKTNDVFRTLPSCSESLQSNFTNQVNSRAVVIKTQRNLVKKFQISVDEMDPETVCGIGPFRPQWLQQFATARMYLVVFAIIGVLQGSYYTYLIGVLSTLEKRYSFKSKVSGTIMMIDEITPLLLGIAIGYFGGRAHRPRLVAVGMFLSALCCFISALPYFLYGTSQQLVSNSQKNNTEYCDAVNRDEDCGGDRQGTGTDVAVACLIIGSFLKGFGNLTYYALGISYMDDTAKKKNTPMYITVSSALRLLGPVIGFLMSYAFLKYYENPLDDPGFGKNDPRWIGGWWIGFVLQGILLTISALPMLLFPRRLPKQRERTMSNTKNFQQETLVERMKGLIEALKRLAKNPLFCCFTLSTVFAINGGYGYFIMLPKYTENQFRLSASEASLLSGPPGIVAFQLSSILGGIAIWKWKPSFRKIIFGSMIAESIVILGYLALMIPQCGNLNMPGTTFTDKGLQLENNCNVGCDCTTNVYSPVCGTDGVSTYFSPCFAGCQWANETTNSKIYYNCTCGMKENFTVPEMMTNGTCKDDNCWSKNTLAYISLLPFLSAVNGIFRVGHTLILLRCVMPQDKSIAIGTFETLLCIFAFIPYPVVYGALVDSACLVWEMTCGLTGNCWVYNLDTFRRLLHIVTACFCFCSLICSFLMYFLSHHIRSLYSDDDEEFTEDPTTSPPNKQNKIATHLNNFQLKTQDSTL